MAGMADEESAQEERAAKASGESRRGRPRSEAAHRAVLEAVADLLDAQGSSYEELTIERIAAQAGVGKQTIYRWWQNKAAVVLEALLTGHLKLDFAPVPDTGDLRADLLAWIDLAEDKHEEGPDDSTSMARSLIAALVTSGEETQELLRSSTVWEDNHLAVRLRIAAENGELRAGVDPATAAAALFHPVILATITTGKPGAEWTRGLVDVVLEGVRA